MHIGSDGGSRSRIASVVLSALLSIVLAAGQVPLLAYAIDSPEETTPAISKEENLSDNAPGEDAPSSAGANGSLGEGLGSNGATSESVDEEGNAANRLPDESSDDAFSSSDSVNGAVDGNAGDNAASNNEALANEVFASNSATAKDEDGAAENDFGSLDKQTEESEGMELLSAASARDAESDRIYSSVDSLVAGEYTVTANVSMMTPIPGVRGYATNPINPESIGGLGGIPNMPRTNNATLVVDSEGEYTLVIDLVNPVFTIQQIGTGNGVAVVDYGTSPIETKEDDQRYNQSLENAGISTRISQLTLRLDNLSGVYSLTGCKEYATTLGTSNPSNGWLSNDLDIDVDLANAVRHLQGDYERTFVDDQTGISVYAAAEEGSPLIATLENTSLEVEVVQEGTERDSVQAALLQQYTSAPDFVLYSIRLVSNGVDVDLSGAAKVVVSFPGDLAFSEMFYYDGSSLEALAAESSSDVLAFQVDAMGYFVSISSESAVEARAWTYSSHDETTGISFGYATDGKLDGLILGGDESMGTMYLNWYKDYFGYYYSDDISDAHRAQTLALVQAEGDLSDPLVLGGYSAGWSVEAMMGLPIGILCAPNYSFAQATNPAWMSLPAEPETAFYYASGTVGSGITSATKMSSSYSSGKATVMLTRENTGVANPVLPIYNAASGVDGSTGMPQTDETPIAYIVAVQEAPTVVSLPQANTGLVYNGEEQVGVSGGEGYSLTDGFAATNAGSYTCLATLESGYVWEDGSSDPAPITWSIAPAELTATYVGEEIPSTSKPELKVEVEGFVNGETAETADGYEAPYVTAPDIIEEGETYELTPEGGKAANYTFTYKSGQLRVAAPESLEPGTYSITANLRMPGEYNPVIAGLDVYANSPDNPFGPVIDENDPAEVGDSVPNTPESMNATLVVGEDGTKTLVLPIKNPVFTMQDLGTCADLKNVKTERVYPADSEEWDYGSYETRIHKMSAELTDSLTEGTISYLFTGSVLYAVPLDLELKPSGSVALELQVDYSSMEKVSDSTQVPVLDEAIGEDDQSDPDPDLSDPSNPDGNQGGSDGQGSGNQGGITGGNGTQVGPGTAGTVDSGTLKAGTYTVSANIWFDKADTGLPLNPHITSSVFPPMNPVSNNATLTVDSSGRARVSVPITIQDKVMSVKSISGLNIVNSSSSGGKLTSITVDLGVIDASTSVITESCSVGIHIGDIAATIMPESVLQGTREHTWPATFQVNFSGVPASGGGTVPASVQALLNGSTDGSTLESATADEAAADAQAAGEAAAALASRNANAGSGSGVGAAVRSLEDAMEHNPWLGFALGAGTVLVLGAIGVGLYAWRRRVAQAAADGSATQTPTV